MQRAVNNLTDAIFPRIYVFQEEGRQHLSRDRYVWKLSSSLPLQMALYFNVYYFPFWLIINITMLYLKYVYLHPLYRVVLIAILIVSSGIEVCRLYLGYLGNLSEMIPELAGFWLVTLLLQFPLQAFLLLNEAVVILPMERAANIIMISFVILELCFGYIAIKKVSSELAKKFHLETFSLDSPSGVSASSS